MTSPTVTRTVRPTRPSGSASVLEHLTPAVGHAADTTSTVTTVLVAAGHAGVTPCLWGPPGVGKSSLIEQLAVDLDRAPFEPVIAAFCEPSDIQGLPVVTPDGVKFDPPAWGRRVSEAGRGTVLFDELTGCEQATQQAAMRTIFNRRVADLVLGPDVWIFAAANPPDMAANGHDLTPPMANRLLHVDFTPSVESWAQGMIGGFRTPAPRRVLPFELQRRNLSRATVASYVKVRQNVADCYPTSRQGGATAAGRAWPSRRSWTMLADVLSVLPPDDEAAINLAAVGCVGKGYADEFVAWLSARDLPHPADVLDDPHANVPWADLSRDPSRLWAILASVVAYTTGQSAEVWRSAWRVLAVAVEHGRQDVATATAMALAGNRPGATRPPREARVFLPHLQAAGLLPQD